MTNGVFDDKTLCGRASSKEGRFRSIRPDSILTSSYYANRPLFSHYPMCKQCVAKAERAHPDAR